jgi:hypothetical protein
MKRIALLSLAFLASSVFAADRAATLKALIDAQGLATTFEQQLASSRGYGQKMVNDMLDQVYSSLNPPEKAVSQLKEAAAAFMKELDSPLGTKELVDLWTDYYGKKFTDQELEDLLKFYSSPLAQREVVAGREAMTELSQVMQRRFSGSMEAATIHFTDKVKAIVKDCNCAK